MALQDDSRSTLVEQAIARTSAPGALDQKDGQEHDNHGHDHDDEHEDGHDHSHGSDWLEAARIAFVAHLLARNGVLVITAAISPFRSTRDEARKLIGDFVEIHVAPPLEECIKRDVKGLYQKAIAGEIKQFTGISDPYEDPLSPELELDTSRLTIDEGVSRILGTLRELGYLDTDGAGQALEL